MSVKHKIAQFISDNKRLPRRNTSTAGTEEHRLATSMYILTWKDNPHYDKGLASLARAYGKKNKRQDTRKRKSEILAFIKSKGRPPNQNSSSKREVLLAKSLSNYTTKHVCSDATFTKKVASLDKCFRSGVPLKHRPVINKKLNQSLRTVSDLTRSL